MRYEDYCFAGMLFPTPSRRSALDRAPAAKTELAACKTLATGWMRAFGCCWQACTRASLQPLFRLHLSITAAVVGKTLQRMASRTRSQALAAKRDREGEDHLASATKPGRDGSETQKAPRALDDVDVDVTTDRVDLPKTLPAAHIVIKTLHRKCRAFKAENESLDAEVGRLKALLLRDGDADDAAPFEGFGSDDDLSVARALSPDDERCLRICHLAQEQRLWTTWRVQDTVDELHVVAAKLELSHDGDDAEGLLVERSELVAKLSEQLSRAAFVDGDAAPWQLRGCESAAQCYDVTSRFDFGKNTVREAWFLAHRRPYDAIQAYDALELEKWCRCRNCVVGFAENTPRALFLRDDGVVDTHFSDDVRRHHDQIEALEHSRRCVTELVESGTAPGLQMPTRVEMPVTQRCLCYFAQESVKRAAPLVDAFEGLRWRFKVLKLADRMSSTIAFGGGPGFVQLLVLAGADANVDETRLICVCNVKETIMTDCTAAANNRHETAIMLQRNSSEADNANVRHWLWRKDSRGVSLYVFDPLTGLFYRRIVRKAGLEKKYKELASYAKDVRDGDFVPDVLILMKSTTTIDGSESFTIPVRHVKITSVERVPPTLDRAAKLAIRNGERDPPQDTYRLQEYDSPPTHVKDYALVYAVTYPSACRYATIDHTLGNRDDHSIGMLRSVSTSENSRVKEMVDKEGGYVKARKLYARMFPPAAATA